ncbi:MAG: hypothetical protein MJ214_00970 [Bacilli bacterium]|nr:hypothetical protein [Bacilli bacterium]
MRDPKRIPIILKEIEKIWNGSPDLRLGQLLCNVLRDPALYYVEDEKLIEYLKMYYCGSEIQN